MTRLFLFLLTALVARAGCILPNATQPNLCLSDAALVSKQTAIYTDPAMGAGLEVLRYAASFSVTFPAPPGFYRLTVTLVEPNKTAAGQRVFSISANGAPTGALDLWANAGTLGRTTVQMLALSNGRIRLDFVATAGNALYNRIDFEYATLFDVFFEPLVIRSSP